VFDKTISLFMERHADWDTSRKHELTEMGRDLLF